MDKDGLGQPRISFGQLQPNGQVLSGDAGIEFDAYADVPAPWSTEASGGGDYQWVQLITKETITVGKKTLSVGPGLDLTYPYGINLAASDPLAAPPQPGETEQLDTFDTPSLSWTNSKYARDDFQAQMILQYRPPGAGDNDWVALEFV